MTALIETRVASPRFDRLLSKIERRGDGECWPWTGGVTGRGYGSWSHNASHRWIYELMVGPIPDGLTIDHLCRFKLCMNPAHMEPVTNAENIRRRAASVTHCPRGHEHTPANNIKHAEGGKKCRTCHNERRRKAA